MNTEYFWLLEIHYHDGVFTGKIDNDPDEVHTVKLGQKIDVPKAEISIGCTWKTVRCTKTTLCVCS